MKAAVWVAQSKESLCLEKLLQLEVVELLIVVLVAQLCLLQHYDVGPTSDYNSQRNNEQAQ